ncbi:MAG: hypothetical protein ACFFDU_05380 [Candidatus Thorarchaeota archaeon]
MRFPKDRFILTVYSTIGATIISTAILHVTFTRIYPIIAFNAIFLLFIPAFLIGVLAIEFKDALVAMFLTMVFTIVLFTYIRALPAFLGIITQAITYFIIGQFALSLPIFFPLVLVFVLGTIAGLIFNEFVIEPRTKELV